MDLTSVTGGIYRPILRAKPGEISALAYLSPVARRATVPMLDIPRLRTGDTRNLDAYLSELSGNIQTTWGTRDGLYLDMSRFPPDLPPLHDLAVVEYLFFCARQRNLKAIPVAGPELVRGPGTAYLDAVARIAACDKRGIGLRLPYEAMRSRDKMIQITDRTLSQLKVSPDQVDLFLDLEALILEGREALPPAKITADLSMAVTVARLYRFRRTVLTASALPDATMKEKHYRPLRVPRTDLAIWRDLLLDAKSADVAFGDYGVAHPRQTDPNKKVLPPARIRFTTVSEYVSYRAPRNQYRRLCRVVSECGDYMDRGDSWGRRIVRACAEGSGDTGGPSEWISRDTNLHIEATARLLLSIRGVRGSATSGSDAMPWLQDLLFASPERF